MLTADQVRNIYHKSVLNQSPWGDPFDPNIDFTSMDRVEAMARIAISPDTFKMAVIDTFDRTLDSMGVSESEIILAIKLVGDDHAVNIFAEMARICDENARDAAKYLEKLQLYPSLREWERDIDTARRDMHEKEIVDSKRHAVQWHDRESIAQKIVDG